MSEERFGYYVKIHEGESNEVVIKFWQANMTSTMVPITRDYVRDYFVNGKQTGWWTDIRYETISGTWSPGPLSGAAEFWSGSGGNRGWIRQLALS